MLPKRVILIGYVLLILILLVLGCSDSKDDYTKQSVTTDTKGEDSENNNSKQPLTTDTKGETSFSELGSEYDSVYFNRYSVDADNLYDMEGMVAYIAEKNGKKLIVQNNKELRKFFEMVYSNTSINSIEEFNEHKNGKRVTVYEGKEFEGEKYNLLILVENSISSDIIGERDGKHFKLPGSNVFGFYEFKKYPNFYHMFSADLREGKFYLVYDGKDEIHEYVDVLYPLKIGEKIAFFAYKYKNDKQLLQLLIFDGKEIGKDYKSFGVSGEPFIIDVGGKLAYPASKLTQYENLKEGEKYNVVFDGKELPKHYTGFTSAVDIDGKLAFIASDEDHKDNFLVYDGKEVNYGLDKISSIKNIGGKLLVIGSTSEGIKIVYDNKNVGDKFGSIYGIGDERGRFISQKDGELGYLAIFQKDNELGYLAEKNGKLFIFQRDGELGYLAEKNGKLFIVVDEKIIGKKIPISKYDKLYYVSITKKDQIIFLAEKNNKKYAVFDGTEFGPYDEIGFSTYGLEGGSILGVPMEFGPYGEIGIIGYGLAGLGNILDVPTFQAKVNNKSILIFNKTEIDLGIGVENSLYSFLINKKPGYVYVKDNEFFIQYDNQIIGDNYSLIEEVFDVGGKLAFVAAKDGKRIIVHDGNKLGTQYDLTGRFVVQRWITTVGNELAYIARNNETQFVVYKNKEIEGYDKISQLQDFNGKLAFIATKNGKNIVVIED